MNVPEFLERLEKKKFDATSSSGRRRFKAAVLRFYHRFGRMFPWRETTDPYHILVSELMLQQTQTDRVIPKYLAFVGSLPTIQSLAHAPTHEILTLWSGLGYYRRALNLKRAAQEIVSRFDGRFPNSYENLVELPGVGPYTAGAMCNFAFNTPVPIVETNIRTVYLHLLFRNRSSVHDKDIMKVVTLTTDSKNPREWFYALMDLGASLKRFRPKINHRSKHHARQSKFEGSHRQKRASLLRVLRSEPSLTVAQAASRLMLQVDYAQGILNELSAEGFLEVKRNRYQIRRD